MTAIEPRRLKETMFLRLGLALAFGGALSLEAMAQTACAIHQPTAGQQVGREVQATGTARVTAGQHAWLVARRSDFAPHWWLQRRLQVSERTPEWRSVAALGVPHDIGWDFDIAVVIVAGDANRRLQEHWDRAIETGDFRPIRIPEAVAAPCIVTVRKSRH